MFSGSEFVEQDQESSIMPPATSESLHYHLPLPLPPTAPDSHHPRASQADHHTESPKRESSEWTDKKHCLYLKSMEATFIDQLHNSLDMRSLQTQSECSSDSMSSRRMYTGNRSSSGQFKVLQHGFWSRIDFRRENNVRYEANRPLITSSNPWIQHFRTGNRHGTLEPPSAEEKPLLTANSQEFPASDLQLCCQQTSCSDIEVTDQNFVEDDYAVPKVNTLCNKKRKITSAVFGSGNDQATSFQHFSSGRNS